MPFRSPDANPRVLRKMFILDDYPQLRDRRTERASKPQVNATDAVWPQGRHDAHYSTKILGATGADTAGPVNSLCLYAFHIA